MTFCAEGWLVWLLALGSSTPRAALLLCFLAASICFVVRIAALFTKNAFASILLSFGVTALLYTVVIRVFPTISFAPPLWIALAFFAGEMAHDTDTPLPYHTVPVLLSVGALREILSNGSLWGLSLLPMELSPAFANGVGGWLIAAVTLWVARLHPPLFRQSEQAVSYVVLAGTTAIGTLIGVFTAQLPVWIPLWSAVVVCAVAFAVLPTTYTSRVFTVCAPLAAYWAHSTENRWLPLVLSVGAVIAVWGLISSVHYRRLYPIPSHFAGVPSALTISTVIYGVVSTVY